MSSRRKHVTQEVRPPGEGQQIVRAIGIRGDNLVEVEFPDGSTALVLLPARFHKKLWVRRGGFLVVQQEPGGGGGSTGGKARVTGSIESVLLPEDVTTLKRLGCWPPEFDTQPPPAAEAAASKAGEPGAEQPAGEAGSGSDSEDGLPPLVPNSNRPVIQYAEESSSEDE